MWGGGDLLELQVTPVIPNATRGAELVVSA